MQPPSTHLVIARYKEDLSWVPKLPHGFEVFIYNKGPDIDPDVLKDRPVHIIPRPNVGRESETFAHHIDAYYGRSADWTYFLQGNPFEQAPHVLELLNRPPDFPMFRPLTNQYLARDGIPPQPILDEYTQRTGRLYRFERLSTRTIIPIMYHDVSGYGIGQYYLQMHKLPIGINIMRYFFQRLGLEGWLSEDVEVINILWGAMFGVSRAAIAQHPQSVYKRLLEESVSHQVNGFLIERCWCLLFDRYLAQTYEP